MGFQFFGFLKEAGRPSINFLEKDLRVLAVGNNGSSTQVDGLKDFMKSSMDGSNAFLVQQCYNRPGWSNNLCLVFFLGFPKNFKVCFISFIESSSKFMISI